MFAQKDIVITFFVETLADWNNLKNKILARFKPAENEYELLLQILQTLKKEDEPMRGFIVHFDKSLKMILSLTSLSITNTLSFFTIALHPKIRIT